MARSQKYALWSGGLVLATLLIFPPWKNPGGFVIEPAPPARMPQRCFHLISDPPPPGFTIDTARLCLIASTIILVTGTAIVTMGRTRD